MNGERDTNTGDDRAAKRLQRRVLWKALGASALSGLGGGMPVSAHPDERINAEMQRWAARGGAFLSIALGIDLIVRVFVLRQDPRFYMDIALIWLVNLFIVTIGMIRCGVPAAGVAGKLSWKTSGFLVVLIGLEIPALMWLMGDIHTLPQFLFQAALAGGAAAVMLLIMRAIYGNWERRALGQDSQGGD